MRIWNNNKRIKPGTFKSVGLWYGNKSEEVIELFLSKGWKVSSTVPPDYKIGNKRMFITFESGANAEDVNIDKF